jgi:hypothetical protein
MNLKKLVRQIMPEDYSILGLRLRPFCLGHYFLMQKYNCAFISEVEGTANVDDLLIGLVICSHSHEDFLEFEKLKDNSWLDRTAVWQWLCNRFSFLKYHPLSLTQWCKQWGKAVAKQARKGNVNLIFDFNRFQKYLAEGKEIPSHDVERDDEGDRAESGTHWTQNVIQVLTKELGYTHSEAMNLPLSHAFADYFKWLESEGAITIHTEEDAGQFEEQLKNNDTR